MVNVESKKTEKSGNRIVLKIISVSCIFSILATMTLLISSFTFSQIRKEKINDLWALTYLQLEVFQKNSFSRLKDNDLGDGQLVTVPRSLIEEKLTVSKKAAFARDYDDITYFFYNLDGNLRVYEKYNDTEGFSYSGDFFIQDLFRTSNNRTKDLEFWVINRYGELLWASNSAANISEISESDIFKEFLLSPFNSGMKEFEVVDDRKLGVYSVASDTNLMFFATTSKSLMMSKFENIVNDWVKKILYCILIVSFMTLIFIIFWKRSKIDTRNSQQKLDHTIIKEIENDKLVNLEPNFSDVENGKKIDIAYVEDKDTNRGEHWYASYPFKNGSEFIVISSKVSTTGIESLLINSVVASVFESKTHYHKFDTNDFIKQISSILYKLGRGKWSSSISILSFDLKKRTCKFYGVGDSQMLLVNLRDAEKQVVEFHNENREKLGSSISPKVFTNSFDLSSDMSFYLSSVNLVDSISPKKLNDFFNEKDNLEVEKILNGLMSLIDDTNEGSLCITGLKFVS